MINKFLAFDTSNYTTSVATVCGNDYSNIKKLLPVKQGEKGLRQSDAVFAHIKQLPDLYGEVVLCGVAAVGVSTRPRNVDGSYMPCFKVGESFSKIVAKTIGVPLYEFSHQQGHIGAGLMMHKSLLGREFLSFHMSGGTMELLLVKNINDIEIICKTEDITAGQLIDRTGVMLDLPFPCGMHIETLAKNGKSLCKITPSNKDGNCSLSGFENKIKTFIKNGISKEDICLYALDVAVENINTMLKFAPKLPCLFVGGVMSNEYIKSKIDWDGYFIPPNLSSDNAVGIAYLTDVLFSDRKECL